MLIFFQKIKRNSGLKNQINYNNGQFCTKEKGCSTYHPSCMVRWWVLIRFGCATTMYESMMFILLDYALWIIHIICNFATLCNERERESSYFLIGIMFFKTNQCWTEKNTWSPKNKYPYILQLQIFCYVPKHLHCLR